MAPAPLAIEPVERFQKPTPHAPAVVDIIKGIVPKGAEDVKVTEVQTLE